MYTSIAISWLTEYSALDGLATVPEYVEKAVELGMPALAITDHGVLCGVPEFYHECRKHDIEPIVGQEFYFVHDAAYRPTRGEEYERYHVVVLGRGEPGYRLLAELSSAAHRQYYYKPLLDRALIESLGSETEYLTVLSGCAASIISQAVRAGDERTAAVEVAWWREQFPHFYIELQHHETEWDRQLNTGLVKLAKRYHLPWVVTNDPHYVDPEDEPHHDALLAIQTASDMSDPNRLRFDGTGYHLRSRAEMAHAFRSYGRAVWGPGAAATVAVARDCLVRIPAWETRSWMIPTFPGVEDAYAELKRLTFRGLRERGWDRTPHYLSRTKDELKDIKQAGIANFLLITRDILEWARQQEIPIGPGRGSVCGTLVGYLIGLHKIDPVRYDLRFDRFLNLARPRMPDIDSDFGRLRRDEVFDYVKTKYGEENVVHVCMYGRMRTKRAFQSLAKSYGISYPERIRISKELPDNEDEVELPEAVAAAHPALAAQLKRLIGVKAAVSTHPAGVIIADPNTEIHKLVPEMWIANTKRTVGQYDLEAAEMMGLMKEDFLGLRTLDTVAECVALVKELRGEVLDPDAWVPDEEPGDEQVFALLAAGRTAGVFQMEGPVNTRGCKEVQPICFEDLVSITSLYRTGCISAGFPKIFNENRQRGRRRIPYHHPSLKPILERTWGVVLYQEQVMDMAEKLAGFDMGLVDDLKESVKHKKSALLKSMGPKFRRGCVRHAGMTTEESQLVWGMIKGVASYLYNRSHAVAYTMLTYQTARLKTFYTQEYLTALLRTVDPDKAGREKRFVYLKEAIDMGLKVLPPCINRSGAGATPGRGSVRFGLTDITGVGAKQAKKLLEARPAGGYESVAEIATAANNSGVMKVLHESGALRMLDQPANRARQEALLGWTFQDRMAMWRERYEDSIWLPGQSDHAMVNFPCEIYQTTLGRTKDGKPYVTWKVRYSLAETFDVRLWSECERHFRLKKGSIVFIHGTYDPRWGNVSIGRPGDLTVLRAVV